MDEEIRLYVIDTVKNSFTFKSYLQHLLDATRQLLNHEDCTLSLTIDDGIGTQSIISSADTASTAPREKEPEAHAAPHSEEEIRYRQPLALRSKGIHSAASSHHATAEPPKTDESGSASLKEVEYPQAPGPFIELRLVRKRPSSGLNDSDTDAIQRVLESMNRAISAYIDAKTNDYQATILDRLLAHLSIGLIRLDRNFNIIEKSGLADGLLESTGIYRCELNRLVKTSPRQDDIVERVAHTLNSNDLPYAILDVVTTRNKGQCAIVLARLSTGGTATSDYLAYILCSIADHFEAGDLLDFWKISRAEKRVLSGLARFGNIKKVALELGISPNTVKTQLKSAYKKLGVDNKISLLRRFSLLRLIDALATRP